MNNENNNLNNPIYTNNQISNPNMMNQTIPQQPTYNIQPPTMQNTTPTSITQQPTIPQQINNQPKPKKKWLLTIIILIILIVISFFAYQKGAFDFLTREVGKKLQANYNKHEKIEDLLNEDKVSFYIHYQDSNNLYTLNIPEGYKVDYYSNEHGNEQSDLISFYSLDDPKRNYTVCFSSIVTADETNKVDTLGHSFVRDDHIYVHKCVHEYVEGDKEIGKKVLPLFSEALKKDNTATPYSKKILNADYYGYLLNENIKVVSIHTDDNKYLSFQTYTEEQEDLTDNDYVITFRFNQNIENVNDLAFVQKDDGEKIYYKNGEYGYLYYMYIGNSNELVNVDLYYPTTHTGITDNVENDTLLIHNSFVKTFSKNSN